MYPAGSDTYVEAGLGRELEGAHRAGHFRGVATVVPGTGNAQWRIAFFGGLVRADYLVMDVAPDYSWALIANPKRSLAWIFAREAQMDDVQFEALKGRFAEWGYEPAKIVRVKQDLNTKRLGEGR